MNVYAIGDGSPNLLALENTLATVFGRCLRVRQYVEGNFLLLAFNGEEIPSFDRLETRRIEARFGKRPETTEWGDLLRQANWFRTEGESRNVEPREDRWVLTDDHAPLEWLTDRFLDRTEAEVLRSDDPRRADLLALALRQKRLLWLTAAAYAVALLVLVPRLRK
jgi:hypothetical protein